MAGNIITLVKKVLLVPLLTCGVAGCVAQSPFVVRVAQHNREFGDLTMLLYEADRIKIGEHDSDDVPVPVDFLVLITAKSSHDVLMYEEWNSLGRKTLELEVRTNSVTETITLQKRTGQWGANYPSLIRIPRGTCMAFPVALDRRIWDGLPTFSAGDVVYVRATVYPCLTMTSRGMRVDRSGPVTSPWLHIRLRTKDVTLPDKNVFFRKKCN